MSVSHERELRGVWVATVGNIDFPTKTGLTAAEQKADLVKILDTLASAHFNAVIFQVRPEADALYASSLEPWSRYLTGTQGKDPGYDPLAYLIQEARARSIEVHAWFNPYRAKADAASKAVPPHISLSLAQYAYTYGSYLWMDPGAKEVENHTVKVILDVVSRYDVDGAHFDDYFYPYPDGTAFPDAKTYSAYVAQGGSLSKDDWRRDNVNGLVRRVSQEIAKVKPHVRFGISPFGIYRPGIPAGITGLDQYAEIYADPPLWKKQGWVDYLAPQLYWPSTQKAQAYGTLVEWWAKQPSTDQYTFAGNFLSKLGSSTAWTVDEFRTQVKLSRAQSAFNSKGNIFFSFAPLRVNKSGILDVFRDEVYPAQVLTPPLASMRGQSVAPPDVTLDGKTVRVSHAMPGTLRAWVVYTRSGSAWKLDRIVPVDTAKLPLDSGAWAIAAAGRHGVESPGVVVDIQ